MRLGIVSDIHGNRFALEATLRNLDDLGIDRLICLGDVVGYGPDPESCLDLLLERDAFIVLGNHEEAVLDPRIALGFRDIAREAIDWTRRRLRRQRPDLLERLSSMPGMGYIGGAVMCVHDSPVPGGRRYLVEPKDTVAAFRGVDVPICLVGHTHLPAAFRLRSDNQDGGAGTTVEAWPRRSLGAISIEPRDRWIVNPGAVGQPRDGDPRASFGMLDLSEGTMTWRRVAYDIASAQQRAIDAGLPLRTAERLAVGA
ncbi:MAG: metallophosphoesterase family protein [Planctomycetota bacterium]|nr:metallophosphoesterase family protein [Planctomycetota bacterium]